MWKKIKDKTISLFRSVFGSSKQAIVLIGPAYDAPTRVMSVWLRSLKLPRTAEASLMLGPHVSKGDLADLLRNKSHMRKVEIFCGHGLRDALLGPPKNDGHDIESQGDFHSILYDKTLFDPSISALFAFCCNSGRKFGRDFCKPGNRTFLGYSGVQRIILMNEECTQTWMNIFKSISEEIIREGAIGRRQEQILRKSYAETHSYFDDGPGKDNDQALLMRIYVRRHMKMLQRY